jgi:hypothetical protein
MMKHLFGSIAQLVERLPYKQVVIGSSPVAPMRHTGRDSKIGLCQGGAQNLHQAKPAPKQLNLNKLSDAGGGKFCGCPTTAESILECRAV